jgi:putative transposase
MRKQKLVVNYIYHIYNRGVEKRRIFLDNKDFTRFANDLIVFNDKKLVINPKQRLEDIQSGQHKRTPLVDIIAFCLMQNHYHLLLKQKVNNGITEFMRKLGAGYANYFNLKHQRVGALFQGKFKSVLINDESQFLYIPFYIHLNPLDMIFPDWREKGVNDYKKAINFLDNYNWSSHATYRGSPNFPLILAKDAVFECFESEDDYSYKLSNFIKDFNFSEFSEFLLE